jgi:biotin transport system substrate-specific component
MQTPIALTLTRRVSLRHTALMDALLVITGSLVVAALAQIRIPLPFTPVPFTGQTLGVLLVAAALGSSRGAASLALYLVEGILGLPVFAGAPLGIARLLGPTGGYLVGFIVAAYLVGALAERGMDRDWKRVLGMFAAGMAVIYLFGVAWLSRFTGLGNALVSGLWPFIPGDIIKAVMAAALLPSAWRWVNTLS